MSPKVQIIQPEREQSTGTASPWAWPAATLPCIPVMDKLRVPGDPVPKKELGPGGRWRWGWGGTAEDPSNREGEKHK